jgi:hypoxanthine phosphoribosyltransferase
MALEPLITEGQIAARVRELAALLRQDYEGEDLLLVGVLKGSAYFLADLSRALDKEDVEMDFMQVSSYGNEQSSSGIVKIKKDLDANIEGRNVLIVEDIVDTGATLNHLRELLGTRKPKSLKVISLLSKPEARLVKVLVEYVGFEIPSHFVVGYGLDYGERYRNLPYIAILP